MPRKFSLNTSTPINRVPGVATRASMPTKDFSMTRAIGRKTSQFAQGARKPNPPSGNK